VDEWQERVIEHRKEGRTYEPLYRDWCIPNREWQLCKLEALRYKYGRYKGKGGTMQALGDWGRLVAPLVPALIGIYTVLRILRYWR